MNCTKGKHTFMRRNTYAKYETEIAKSSVTSMKLNNNVTVCFLVRKTRHENRNFMFRNKKKILLFCYHKSVMFLLTKTSTFHADFFRVLDQRLEFISFSSRPSVCKRIYEAHFLPFFLQFSFFVIHSIPAICNSP